MIESIIILIVGMFLGALLLLNIFTFCLVRSARKKQNPSKDEWRHM